jgi:N-methylhydantoinase B
MVYRFVETGVLENYDDRWFVPLWGVNGGEPGGRACKLLVKADGSEIILPNKCGDYHEEAGDWLHFITWGGSWGDPLERGSALLAKEMKQDLMTAEGALRYGAMRGARGPVDTFYCGPDSELRTNCLAETGLPAPRQPLWLHAEVA